MKKIITMVGTSLFENYLEKNNNINFENAYNFFKDNKLKASELDNEKSWREIIENGLKKNYFKNNPSTSAEIKSLIKLKEELKDEFEIYLLYSDTVLSRLAGEILEKAIYYYDEFKDSTVKIKEIEDLQIWDKKEFEKGMVNLIYTIYDIAQEYWENIT